MGVSQTHSPFHSLRARGLRHGGQEIDERIGPEQNKSPERQLKRDARGNTHRRVRLHVHAHRHVRKSTGASVCVISIVACKAQQMESVYQIELSVRR